MPRIFRQEIVVPAEAIGELGLVDGVVYLRWMQDLATAHSAAQGWPLERYFAVGGVWVAASHSIRYHRPARLGETVEAVTWIADFGRVRSHRRYAFRRRGRLLAEAETLWAWIDRRTGHPALLPEAVRASFEPATAGEDASLRRGG